MFGTISKMLGFTDMLSPLSGWFIRLPFAATFLFHGYSKFEGGIGNFAANFGEGGVAFAIALAVGVAEVLAGVGAIVGGLTKDDLSDAATKLSGLAAAPVLIGAIYLAHWGRFSFTPAEGFPIGGMEFQLLLLGVAIYFLARGKDA